jgi:hypothetical protein
MMKKLRVKRGNTMRKTQSSLVQRVCLTGLTAAALLAASGCKKAPVEPPKAAQEPGPAIAHSGQPFAGASFEAQKVVHDRNASAGAGGSFAHVTYKPEVKVIDESSVVSSIVGVSSDGHGAVFKNAPSAILALKAGDIFMVTNQFAVKVLGSETDGDQTVLIVDRAKLTDIVQLGVIHLDSPISFHGPKLASARPASKPPFHFMDLIEPTVYAQNGTGTPAEPGALQPSYNEPKPGVNGGSATEQATTFFKDLFISGWNVESWSVTPSEDSAVISARMSKDMAGFLGVVTLNGTISNFQFAENLTFPFNTNQIVSGIKGMSGQMTFAWQIGKQTPGVWATEDKLKLPAGVTIPLAEFLGGLPLTLDISAALLIHPALTGGKEYEAGGFTIGFNGSQENGGLTFQINQDQSISPVAPDAMVIAFAAPRIELQVSPLGPFASIKGISTIATAIDTIVGKVAAKILPPNVLSAIKSSPLGNFTVSNALSSKADIFVQVVHTEGVTHSATITLAPCSKVELKVTGQVGGDADLLGMTPGATTAKDIFTKTFTRFQPASHFCESI